MSNLQDMLEDYKARFYPMEYMDWENFDMLISPVINNPLQLYDFMREGHNVNIFEVLIALVFFCYKAHYNDRI